MSNTRKMTLGEYSSDLDAEAEKLRRAIPEMRAELQRDPEGCFGGRGNNIGYAMLEEKENRLAWLTNRGYTNQTQAFIEILKSGADLSTVEKIVARDDKLFIGAAPGYGRKKVLRSGETAEVNWVYVHGDGWKDEEPPSEVLNAAVAITEFFGSSLLEWRGEFHCPLVYL